MIIEKRLKFATFTFDDETRVFTAVGTLDKTNVFAFIRFFLRFSQKMWGRRIRK